MLKNNLETYNSSAESFDKKIASLRNYDESYSFLCSLLDEGIDVLDAACGPANISRFISKNVKGVKFTLIDLSEEMLKLATSYLPEAKPFREDICNFRLNKTFDAVINGFGLPYLSEEEAKLHFQTVFLHLKGHGIFYLSFMDMDEGKYSGETSHVQDEHPSFSPDSSITVTYHSQKHIESLLLTMGFTMLKKWNLDYVEADGAVTTDVVMVLRKS